MGNIIVALIIAGILTLPVIKIIRDKKNNVKCSGCSACPLSGGCSTEKR